MQFKGKKRSLAASVNENETSIVKRRPEHFERSGKWTSEEENFCNRLIVEFEAGSLEDCEEGCTLRSYLARRLRCAPMRISKKFAGRCIGKVSKFELILFHSLIDVSSWFIVVVILMGKRFQLRTL